MPYTEPTGLRILYHIREEAKDFVGLLRALGGIGTVLSERFEIARLLFHMIELGLVDVKDAEFKGKEHIAWTDFIEWARCGGGPKFKMTESAIPMMQSLGISLTELSRYTRGESMIIDPFFGLPDCLKGNIPSLKSESILIDPFFGLPSSNIQEEPLDLFVLMPFADDLKPVHEDHIKKVAAGLNLRVNRADDFFSKQSIMNDIWNAMNRARAIIADCTGRNPNVFYEIGIAHTINKPVILITQNENDVPFDLRHLRFIKYQYTPRGMADFEDKLRTAISLILSEGTSFIYTPQRAE